MKIMAVDYGDARTGLAVCDRTEFLASPIGIIEEKSLAKVAEKIVYASREYEVGMIVIGLPKNMAAMAAALPVFQPEQHEAIGEKEGERMEPAGLSSRYGARRLCDSDVGAVYRLSAGNHIFYKYCPPCVTLESIREDMKVLPPVKSGEDKFYVGFFDGSMLTAVMDLILKYPNAETAYIGLFMVDSASQGKGTGTAIIEECLCFLKRQGLRRARLGFAKGNCQSEAF